MEICKNKSSGSYFIYIHGSGVGEVLLVTPDAQIKSLRSDLFDDIEEYAENYLFESSLVNIAQVQRYNDYRKSRSDEIVDKVEYHFDLLSPDEKKEFIRKIRASDDKS